jgi:hypothetical protein
MITSPGTFAKNRASALWEEVQYLQSFSLLSQQNNLLFGRTQRPTLKAKIGIQIDTQRRR